MRARTVQSAVRSPQSAVGFTLIEMLISLSILAVISAAVGSTIVLAAKALDHEAVPGASTVAARRATDRVLAELNAATAFSERSANAVAFTVPDRDGDGLPETIRYAWSGVAGAPLTRQYNGREPGVIAEDVREFDLSYLLRTLDPPAATEVEGPEQVLIAHDKAPSGDLRQTSVHQNAACGVYFKPALPAAAVRWKVTRVDVVVRRASLLGTATVFFDLTDATADGRPGAKVLATSGVPASGLPLLMEWRTVRFTSDAIAALAPGEALCLVARTNDATAQAAFQYEEDGDSMTPNAHWLAWTRSNGWSEGDDEDTDMRFRVWGTVTTAVK